MNRVVRAGRRSVLVVAAVAAVGFGALAPGDSARADVADDTLQRIANCLHNRHQLSIVLLIDASGSLQTTDPDNDRISAARLAVSNFASLAAIDDGGRKPEIEVLVAGFSSRFEVVVPWKSVAPDNVGELEGPLLSFATRNEGIDTDFPSALVGAQRELVAREGRGCRAVLLFTDGKYDVVDSQSQARVDAGLTKEYAPGISLDEPGSSNQVEILGREYLCRRDGLADQIRDEDITLVTVALSARIDPIDQDFLRALSEQAANGQTCGARRRGAGAYLAAAQLSELKQQFNRVTTAIAGGRAAGAGREVAVCTSSACDEGRVAVPVDAAAGRVSLLVDTGASGVDADVQLPSGETVTVKSGESGSQPVEGGTLRWTWVDDRTVNIESDVTTDDDADGEAAELAVTLIGRDGSGGGPPARIDTFLYNDWAPEMFDDPVLLEGVPQTLRVHVVDADGEPVATDSYRGTIDFAAAITVGDAESVPLEVSGPDDAGRYAVTFEAPEGTGGSTGSVDLDLAVTTAQGIELAPVQRRADLEVRLPDVYPTVVSERIDFGRSRDRAPATAALQLRGGRDRQGCLWIEDITFDDLDGPAIEWSATSTSASDCEQVLANADDAIELELQPVDAADRAVRGEVVVAFHAGEGTETRRQSVPFEFRQLPPIDQGARLGFFVAILAGGLAAPLGAMWLMNRMLARFAAAPTLNVARIPVAARLRFRQLMTLGVYEDVESADDLRSIARVGADGLEPLYLDPSDCRAFPDGTGRTRTVRFDELTFKARIERNPFVPPYAKVDSDRPVAVGPRPGIDSTITDAMPLALAGSFFVVLPDTERTDVPDGWFGADLVVFLAGSDLAAECVEMSRILDEQAGRLVNALRNLDAGISTVDPARV